MKIVFGSTDTGLMRDVNEDCFAHCVLTDDLVFSVLCDGMGGGNGGGVASKTATRFARDMLERDITPGMSELSIRSVMTSAMSGANAVVYDAAIKNPSLSGMGTTMIIAVINGGVLYVAYAGDSRVYLASPRQEHQLTKDHTVVQMLVDIGEISMEDALSHPKRHYITRAVGVGPSVDIDFLVQPLEKDDIVFLCSDGMYMYLPHTGMYGLLERCVEKQSVGELIALANAGGGADNITAVIMAENRNEANG